jgi:hypothetical protein
MIAAAADSAKTEHTAVVAMGTIIKHVTTSDETQNPVHQ